MELKKKFTAAVGGALLAPVLAVSIALPMSGNVATAQADEAVSQVKSVKVSKVTKSSYKVTWKKAPSKKVTGYQLKVYKSGKAVKTYTVKGRTQTSKSVTGLKAGTKYSVKVRAYAASSKKYGAWSSAKSATTPKATSSKSSKKSSAKKSKSHAVGKTVYITKSGKKYHVSSCSSLRRSKKAISLSSAKAQGYKSCHNCI